MEIEGREVRLVIAGFGIIFYSPQHASHIIEGSNYMDSHYDTEEQVQRHIQVGSIVGFGTGAPGTYVLRFHAGYPTDVQVQASKYKLRLRLRVVGEVVCFDDLFVLRWWDSECPDEQRVSLPDGIYHVTLCSNLPESGIVGDEQAIDFYLQRLDVFPALATEGIPHLIQ